MDEVNRRVEFATKISKRAGEILLGFFERGIKIKKKGIIDLVTDADLASEKFIKGEICDKFPEDGILGEEKGFVKGKNNFLWVVDPLDGTVNFSHLYPFFSVSIGIQIYDEVAGGVVFDPVKNELFIGIKGGGSFLNGSRIRVSNVERLVESMLATGFPYDIHTSKDDTVKIFEKFLRSAQAIRRDGSAALDICYVAMGRFDGFWERRLKPWDTAGAKIILEEAGGVVTDFKGEHFKIFSDEILCSNGKIHSEMIEEIKKIG